jgi:hypothetical protein
MYEIQPSDGLSNPDFMEHRWGNRIEIDLEVEIFCFKEPLGHGRMKNVSVSGAFIETDVPLRPMNAIRLIDTGYSKRRGGENYLSGYVSRCTGRGMGLAWWDLAPDCARRLVQQMLQSMPALDSVISQMLV